MSNGIIGRKLGMTSVFASDGRSVPVTVLEAGPCVVTQVKTEARDGYNALQLGFGQKRAARVNKPLTGHYQKSGDQLFEVLREFRVDDPEAFTLGQTITVEMFQVGDLVDVSGSSKGRGFTGVIKRHGFRRGRKTHGSHSYREPGSIGCSATPSKVIRGKKMPGQYGNDINTIKNLEVVDIRPDENLMLLKGAVPGTRSGLVTIRPPKVAK